METHHRLDDADEILLASNEYNELGQLITKKLHSEDDGNSFEQHVDYRYNIRGWLTRINDSDIVNVTDNGPTDYFGMNLLYNEQDVSLGNDDLYNGNISATKWSSLFRYDSLGLSTRLAYTYDYDPMNRLKGASMLYHNAGWSSSSALHEDNLSYDLNGNIQALRRTDKHGEEMDILSYDYGIGTTIHSNKFLSVTDAGDATKGFKDGNTTGDDYAYDLNGNMTLDKNKDIDSITYNHLNLPMFVHKNNGEYLVYVYDAAGIKRSQKVYDSLNNLVKTTDYVGEFIYENDTLKFANHEEGRIILTGSPEYQYHLKDHLGNVRLTFTSKHEEETTTATMEAAHSTEEAGQFLNYAEVQKIFTKVFDHTNEGGTYTSVRLMGGTSTEKYGLAKSLIVMPGDTVNMEVYAKYLDNDPQNWSSALQNVIAAIAGTPNPGGTYVDGGSMGNISGPFPFPGMVDRSDDSGTGPMAYLNYLVFDRDFRYVDGGYRRLTTAAKESGSTLNPGVNDDGIAHERLFIDDIAITQAGYVYIYLSNENPTPVEVYFDDLSVEHIKSPIVQTDEYYPFGLTFNSYQRENSVANRWKFQGQEHIDDLGLGWDSFMWRNHQPDIGRFFNIDPLAEKYYYNSPYAFSENRVIDGRELEGLEWKSIKDENGGTINVITVKVRNSSKLINNTEAMSLAFDIQNTSEKAFSGTDAEGNSVMTLVHLDFESEIEEGDFYIDFVDYVTDENGNDSKHTSGRVDEIGNTQSNRIQVNVDKDRGDIIRSGTHEVGHTGGLTHPQEKATSSGTDKKGNKLDKDNLMIQGGDGTTVTPEQRTDINKEVEDDTKL